MPGGASRGCPVGSSASTHRRAADDRPGDRDPLPLAPRQLGRPGGGPVPEPDRGPARRRPAAAARRAGSPAYSSPSATLPSTLWCSARKNCWNTNPIRDARSAASSRSVIRATSRPVTRTVPGSRLVQGAHQVQQRGLARPRRARRSRPAPRQPPPGSPRASARTGGCPGYTFDTFSSSSTGTAPGRPAGQVLAACAVVMTPAPRLAARASGPGHLHQPVGVIEDPGAAPAPSAACSPGRRPRRRTRPATGPPAPSPAPRARAGRAVRW